MKQLFSYTDSGDLRHYDAKEFEAKTLDSETIEALDGFDARYDALDERQDAHTQENKQPFLTPFNGTLIALGAAIMGLLIYISGAYGSIEGGFDQNPALLILLGVLDVVFTVLFVINRQKKKNESGLTSDLHARFDQEFEALVEEEDALLNQAYSTLGIPSDDCEIDIITPPDGFTLDGMKEFDTVSLVYFFENGILSLTDCRTRWDIPRENIQSIARIEKTIILTDWNKLEAHNHKEYRRYRITEQDGKYTLSGYDLMTILKEGEAYTIALPPYEGDLLRDLLGFSVE